MSGKFALIIGNTEYSDPGLAQLSAPGKDAEDFARVLKDQEIGAFDEVNILLNQPSSVAVEMIDEFFDQKKPDDLLLLYFSGHGVRDEFGALYLAVKNTKISRLRATAIKSDFISESMNQSRSKRQLLILDCCMSGAFTQGTKAATGGSIGTASAFESGYGRIILTASDSVQFAFEGDKVIGETNNSLFTHYLVKGLEGEADQNGDGLITVDELYDYAYEKVRFVTPKQTPSKFSDKQQGEIILRQNMRIEDIKLMPLPAALIDSIENPFSDVRLGAVQQLTKMSNGTNLGLALSAKEELERISKEDDSRTVSRAAFEALEALQTSGNKISKSETKEPIIQKVDTENKEFQKETALPRVILNDQALSVFFRSIISFWEKTKTSFNSFTKKYPLILNLLFIPLILVSIIGLAMILRVLVIKTPVPEGVVSNLILSDSKEDSKYPTNLYEHQDVYAHFILNSVASGTKFKSQWYRKINDAGDGIYLLTWMTWYTTEYGDVFFWLSFNQPTKGSYRVEIYQDNLLVGIKNFSVE